MSLPDRHRLSTWNRKLHTHLGLYLLVSLWLFAVSGLLLNHAWRFTEFWSGRQQTTNAFAIAPVSAADDLGRARDLMKQLGIAGEIEWATTQSATECLDFRVVQPGRIVDVKADWRKRTATVQEIRVNVWGVTRILHTFTGRQSNATSAGRNWWLTRLWSLSMDALAVGLIVLVAGSLIMACERREKWLGAGLALGLGLAFCLFFVFGLRWL
jgi:hypothetical protein